MLGIPELSFVWKLMEEIGLDLRDLIDVTTLAHIGQELLELISIVLGAHLAATSNEAI
jgi:hypothetical protein